MTSITDLLNPIHSQLLSLLRGGLWGKSVNVEHFSSVSYQNWQQIMELAAVQGVFALAYDGIFNLPEELRPPKQLLIQWGLGVKQIELRHLQQLKALQSLSAFYRTNRISCLVIKGLGISKLYPIPHHRESGDLDVFLYGDYEKGNLLIERSGIEVNYFCSVHSKFIYQQVPVENHVSFFSMDWHSADRDFERILEEKLSAEKGQFDQETGVYTPDLSFNLLLIYKHAIKHFVAKGIVLRHLCDMALLLNNCNAKEYHDFYETMKRFNLHRYVNAFNYLAVEYLGLPLNNAFQMQADQRFSQKILTDILLQEKYFPYTSQRNIWQILSDKSRNIFTVFKSRWKYEAVDDQMFLKELKLRSQYAFKEISGKLF